MLGGVCCDWGLLVIKLDVSQYPILVADWVGETTDVDVNQYVAWLHEQLARASKQAHHVIVISDTNDSKGMDSRVRKMMNEQLEAFSPEELEAWVAPYVVVNSSLVRGLIKAVAWMSRGASEKIMNRIQSFSTKEGAFVAARTHLAAVAAKQAS